MYVKTKLSLCVAAICSSGLIVAAENPIQLSEISVAETANSALIQSKITRKEIQQKQARDIKDVLSDQLDVGVSNLQSARSGNDGINLRGLSGNRIATTVDGIAMPEAQEAKHFMSYGMEFGRGDYIEPTSLRGAEVQYGGSEQSLSGGVNFTTLEPEDLLKGRNTGGFVGTGYNSVDNSTYGTLGGALRINRYQGMVMTTLRHGDQTETHGSNASSGSARTEADPADYKNIYVLTKHKYQADDHNKFNFTYEYLHKKTDTDLLSKTGTSIDSGTGTQLYGNSTDKVTRQRFSLGHEYISETGWLHSARTRIYYQDAKTENSRFRQGTKNYRSENSEVENKTFGVNLDLMSYIEGTVPQLLRYGAGYTYTKATNYLRYVRPAYSSGIYSRLGSANFDGKPSADTKQNRINLYIEDEISWGDFVITPHLGLVHYRISPEGNNNTAVSGFAAHKTKQTVFTPKLNLLWKIAPEFEPYFQYSRGVRVPSAQQLTSYFYESPMGYNVAVIGNPNLKAETSHNFELGLQGHTETVRYRISGFYNRYKNFIDWQDATARMNGYTQYVQYQNMDKAKIYGVTASAKWNFYGDFYTDAGLAYARGRETEDGEVKPINSVQPLKTRLGLGYDNDTFGADIHWTYSRGKADKDISGSLAYNPTGGYSVWDLGVYWKPIKDLTLSANLNNIFDKKYWNWNDISYLALLSDGASQSPVSINAANADRYSAPGRNFNVGIRYEF
ncbi:TonB-dependent hemoglobin/transferrin/lactoferrin family receptor [Pasteurellaceae bacterium LIM206]|nr:TonB-dependent hemoglobin/transferrin/lactoferrin family receptor [Pasteurellaceae bacterium LIM206]